MHHPVSRVDYKKIEYPNWMGKGKPEGANRLAKTLFSDDGRELARLLATARAEAGCTQMELARRLGRPQPVISLIERGERRVDVVEFRQIAEALDMDPVALFVRFVESGHNIQD